ncbi:REP-associated tyrosine transposase [Natronincola ferrireducens]|uniref:REP element-mobilizing transposase RayT n=1 Tax=Natronincola ferrireducens TaxID=393762 RepID=A0A1G8ZA55_9FIRM|nr:transposase [Natronincola ferrireducens]SDK11938.1 REP element-mobilizing transposase RayT [Natronincola ferrireducens]
MARQARQKSSTGIYHIMLRGIDGRNIFLDDEDKTVFIEKLLKAKEKAKFKVYAYCLMDNHVHLLIEENEEIGKSIKRITVGYVQWHNNKYGRTGHLFQNRYNSEVIETENYFITVLRYIHQNPVKAKMVNKMEDYLWSSYNQYSASYQNKSNYISTEIVNEYFTKQDTFEKYMNQTNQDECLEYRPVKKYTDEELRKKIIKEFKLNISEVGDLTPQERDRMIKTIYCNMRVSIRQLVRILGLGKSIIEKAIKNETRTMSNETIETSPCHTGLIH